MQIRYFGVMRSDLNKFAYKKCIDTAFKVFVIAFNTYYLIEIILKGVWPNGNKG